PFIPPWGNRSARKRSAAPILDQIREMRHADREKKRVLRSRGLGCRQGQSFRYELRKSGAGRLRFLAKARFTSLTRFHDGGKVLAGSGAHQLFSFEEAGENQALRLLLAMQKLAVIEPIGRGIQRLAARFIEAQSLLERIRGSGDSAGALLGFGGMRERKALQGSVTQLCGKQSGGLIAVNRLRKFLYSGIRIRNVDERGYYHGPLVAMLLGVPGDNFEIGAIVTRGSLEFALLGEKLRQIQLGVGLRRIDINGTLPAINGFHVMAQAMCQKPIVHQGVRVIGEPHQQLPIEGV